jgi:hypothetical protein
MRRLCTDSSCSYSGRSVRQAARMGQGSRTEAQGESPGSATGPYRPLSAARPAVTRGVTGQKSAEAVVAARARSPER